MVNKFFERYRLLYEIIRKCKIGKYIFISGLAVMFGVMEPAIAKYVVKYSVYEFNIELVIKSAGIWLLLFCSKLFLELRKNIHDVTYDVEIRKQFQIILVQKMLKLDYKVFSKESDGYWSSRCIDDVSNLDSFMPKVVVGAVMSFIQFVVTVILMGRINIVLTGVAFVFLLGDAVANFIFPLTKYYQDYAGKRVRILHGLNDIFKNSLLIRCSVTQKKEEKRFAKILDDVYASLAKRDMYNSIRNWGRNFFSGISTPILYFVGGISIINGKIGFDEFIAFMLYFGLLMSSFGPISTFFIRIRNSNVYLDRINEILNLPEEASALGCDIEQINSIEFGNVTVAAEDEILLENVSLSVMTPEKIAIVGESGCGKTTLIKSLLGLVDVASGELTINGRNLKEYSINGVRGRIGYVSQNEQLFSRTIGENLQAEKDDKNIERIVKIAKCDEFLNNKRDLDTVIDGHANNFSGGEKQRLAIARELLKEKDVYVFDEATSALDKKTEIAVFENLLDELKDKIVIFITHNPEMIKFFSKIVFMSEGRVAAIGSHEELMEKHRSYRELYNYFVVESWKQL